MDKNIKTKEFLKDLFFPKFCLGCNAEGQYLCPDCRHLLDVSQFNYCLCSNRPERFPQGSLTGRCPRCKNKELSGLYFALPYKDLPAGRQEKNLTKKLIWSFKYKPYLKDLAKTLASLLIEHFVLSQTNTNEIWETSALIPVPLFKKKLKERGYNQSQELAKELSEILKIPVLSNLLIKTKATKNQMELSKDEREQNLLGAFEVQIAHTPAVIASGSACLPAGRKQSAAPCHSGLDPESRLEIKLSNYKKIFLVDDVYTTGSTMEECARVLKENGFKNIWGICIAREG